MIYDRMIKLTYFTGHGKTFTTVCSFASDKSEQDLQLQIDEHCNRYNVISVQSIEPQDLEFEDLLED